MSLGRCSVVPRQRLAAPDVWCGVLRQASLLGHLKLASTGEGSQAERRGAGAWWAFKEEMMPAQAWEESCPGEVRRGGKTLRVTE